MKPHTSYSIPGCRCRGIPNDGVFPSEHARKEQSQDAQQVQNGCQGEDANEVELKPECNNDQTYGQ